MADTFPSNSAPPDFQRDRGFIDDLRQSYRHGAAGANSAKSTPALGAKSPGARGRAPMAPRPRLPLPKLSRGALLALLPVLLLALGGLAWQLRRDGAGQTAPVAGPATDSPTTGGRAAPRGAASALGAAKQEAPDEARTLQEKVSSAVKGTANKVKAAASTVGEKVSSAATSVRRKAASITRWDKDTKPRGKADPKKPPALGGKRAQQGATQAQQGRKPKSRRAPRPMGKEREVVWGDSLRKISRQHYGDESLWPLIWDYNKERARLRGQDMRDPDLIYPGWKFLIPEKE